MTGLTLRERLGERLAEFPLLRTMVLNLWFALALLALMLLGLVGVASLPKVWRSTPAGIRPEVKVSLLDLMQARALRASAERKAARGDDLGAALAWQTAMANDWGNADLYRGALQHLARAPELSARAVGRTLNNLGWLQRLGATNRSDFELMAVVCDKYGMAADVYRLLNPLVNDLSPRLEAAYLKSLFSVGRYREFGERWETLRDRLPADEPLQLYRAAFLAGWGSPAGMEQNLQKLKATMDDVKQGSLASRLLMSVSRQRLDADLFALALQREQEASRDRVSDHAAYWQLLQAVGRKQEAQRLARDYARPPQSPAEVVVTAEALTTLDLSDECLAYLERHAREFGSGNNPWSAAVWGAYAELLTAQRNWEGLRSLATQMRSIEGGHEVLAGFSRFVEGRAAFATGAEPAARAAFEEAVTLGFPLGRLGIRVGANLLQMGYPDLTLRALLPLEATHENDLEYWQIVFDATYAARDDEVLLLKAAKHAYDLDPRSVKWQCNYAAALLIGQWRLEEALRLTLSLVTQQPNLLVAQLNHIFALVLNGRAEDAAKLLNRLDTHRLSPHEQSAYHLASAAVNHALQNWPVVRADLHALESEPLFPRQQRWLDEIQRSLP